MADQDKKLTVDDIKAAIKGEVTAQTESLRTTHAAEMKVKDEELAALKAVIDLRERKDAAHKAISEAKDPWVTKALAGDKAGTMEDLEAEVAAGSKDPVASLAAKYAAAGKRLGVSIEAPAPAAPQDKTPGAADLAAATGALPFGGRVATGTPQDTTKTLADLQAELRIKHNIAPAN